MPSYEYSQEHKAWAKECSKCSKLYIREDQDFTTYFAYDERLLDGYSPRCRQCDRERKYDAPLKKKRIQEQDWCCAICKIQINLTDDFDHDHVTGKYRGVLCGNCNRGMHYIDRDDWIAAATAYRKRWQCE